MSSVARRYWFYEVNEGFVCRRTVVLRHIVFNGGMSLDGTLLTVRVENSSLSADKVSEQWLSDFGDPKAELDVGPILLTRPNQTNMWSDPTRPDPQVAWNSGPDPARPIYARLLVLPSAIESFGLSTKWRFNSDALPKQQYYNVLLWIIVVE